MNVQFIASMAVIAPDAAESRKLYVDALGLPLEAGEGDDYFHSEHIEGSKHFGSFGLRHDRPAVLRSRCVHRWSELQLAYVRRVMRVE